MKRLSIGQHVMYAGEEYWVYSWDIMKVPGYWLLAQGNDSVDDDGLRIFDSVHEDYLEVIDDAS